MKPSGTETNGRLREPAETPTVSACTDCQNVAAVSLQSRKCSELHASNRGNDAAMREPCSRRENGFGELEGSDPAVPPNEPTFLLERGLPSSASDRKRHLELARSRTAELRAVGWTPERLDPIERARRNPKSLALAIAGKCWDCVGAGAEAGARDQIRDCSATQCPLRSVRPHAGRVTESRRKAIDAKCRRCMGPDLTVRLIRECSVVGCTLHSVRPYQASLERPHEH